METQFKSSSEGLFLNAKSLSLALQIEPDHALQEIEILSLFVLEKITHKKWTRFELFQTSIHTLNSFHFWKELESLISRRRLGEPLQYITGETSFYGLLFQISPGVLIPRPETEILVESVLRAIQSSNKKKILGLEIGIGSGCISLSLLNEVPYLKMMATDQSQEAIQLTKQNSLIHKSSENIELFHSKSISEIFEPLPPGIEFDFLVSNPPYLASSDEIEEEVLKNEPKKALFALDGNEDQKNYFYEVFAKKMQNHVKKDGFFAFEIPHNRAQEIQKIFIDSHFKTEILCDLTGRPRVLKGQFNG